ncbi:MAG: type II toxin-antitoxin system RelE/ParE family toxin [Myxococcales bacterium]|nr:type II toxin-antitoxin system RelE/ParE family toxin [Myxococcales bacterium]
MARVVYSERGLADLELLFDFAAVADREFAVASIDAMEEAVSLLAHHPLIGRPVDDDLRELVISRGKTGYVARYAWLESDDVVMVLAIRHQSEAGYR